MIWGKGKDGQILVMGPNGPEWRYPTVESSSGVATDNFGIKGVALDNAYKGGKVVECKHKFVELFTSRKCEHCGKDESEVKKKREEKERRRE